ncbi:MAG: OpgC domain-containing protein [Fuerstia sp.]|nr:OpgC domain-containing protein [Fuerstiella sp.]
MKPTSRLDSQNPTIESDGNESTKASVVRDWRLDFFRGIALIVIFIDHLEGCNGYQLFSGYTLVQLGYCDASEVFIFISGYVCGMSYGRVLSNVGFMACQRKSLKRCLQLYIVSLVCLLIVINLIVTCVTLGIGDFSGGYTIHGLELPMVKLVPMILFQCYRPMGMDILWLYVYLLLVLPLFLFGMNWRKWITVFIVIGCYCVAQAWPFINYPQYDGSTGHLSGTARTFNYLAWQALFFIGAALGDRKRRGGSIATPRWVPALCGIAVVTVAAGRIAHDHISWNVLDGVSTLIDELAFSRWCTKRTLGVLRIVYFLCLAFFAASVINVTSNLRKTIPVRTLVNCGKNPLPIFCIGLVLTYAYHPVLVSAPGSQVTLIICEVTGCAVMLIAGSLISGAAKAADSKIT